MPEEQEKQAGEPSEQEMRARLEEELRKVRVQDLVLQSVASLVNLTARRIGKDDERDLEQARIGIEAVRALNGLLDPEPQAQVRNALSELQMLYAQHARPGERDAAGQAAGAGAPGEARAPGDRPGPQGSPAGEGSEQAGERGSQGGHAGPGQGRSRREPPPRLWTPPGAGE